jgi:flagellar hook assembly protein FlgD
MNNMTLVLDWTNEQVSVAQTDRVVPGNSDAEASVIAPIVVIGGEITAGPNVVSKQSGIINFFRVGKSLQTGKLTVYDASGNKVKVISINDNSAGSTGKRVVGTWDLTDARGRPVSEGTYLVKGSVTTIDGKKEKVSVIVGVR